MAHTISVSDEVYDKLVEKARRLDLPIGRVVIVDEEKKEVPESKNNEKEFVTREDFDEAVKLVDENFKQAQKRLEETEKKLESIKFCPSCGSQLSLYNTHDHTGSGSRGKEYFELKCVVCGYIASVVMPKGWWYNDERKEVDFRNKIGKRTDGISHYVEGA